MNRIDQLLENDSSYQYVPNTSDTPHGRLFIKLFGKTTQQNKEREIWEAAARLYYAAGLKDGANNMEQPNNINLNKDDYDFLMKLLVLMNVNFQYVSEMPFNNNIPKNYHTGLNVISHGKSMIPEDEMNAMRNLINRLFLGKKLIGMAKNTSKQ